MHQLSCKARESGLEHWVSTLTIANTRLTSATTTAYPNQNMLSP